jgi:hypothetical protein
MASEFRVAVVTPATARAVIVRHHYSKAWPTGNFVSFGAFLGGKMCGVATFGHPANQHNWKTVKACKAPRDMAELTRLWIADWAPPFVESRTIAACLRILRRDKVCKVALSYADPSQGHFGTVYQASNWVFAGQSAPSQQLRFSDGTLMHKIAALDRFGTDRADRLKNVDPGVVCVSVPGKFKYLYAIDPDVLPELKKMAKPYPKKPCAGPERATGDHPEEGGADPTPALHSNDGEGSL